MDYPTASWEIFVSGCVGGVVGGTLEDIIGATDHFEIGVSR